MKLVQPPTPQARRRNNIITARIVPVFLLGIIGYTSWVLTKLVCVDYLIRPRPSITNHVTPRRGSAIAVLTIYYFLLLITLLCFTRLIVTITIHPGLVPRGEHYYLEKERSRLQPHQSHAISKEESLEYQGYTPRHLRHPPPLPPADPSHDPTKFWHKDIFTCQYDGRPRFCSTCYNPKPDRAHHCSELNRCVYKMDHFCPWVAGIVSETSFKFFIQFTGWGGLYCLHTLIAMAYFFAKRREEERGFINVHWILVLVLAGLFFLFGAGMCGSSLQFAFLNSTTIENFTRKTKIWYVAVLVPGKVLEKYVAAGRSDLRLITYPRPSSEQAEVLAQAGGRFNDGDSQQSIGQGRDHWDSHPHSCVDEPTAPEATYNPNTSSHSSTTTTTFPSHPAIPRNTTPTTLPSQAPLSSQSQIQHRTFAILATTPGANPFDLGAFQNFKQVMGHSVIDWILPIRESPVTDHSSPHSMYPVGPVVETLVRAADVDGWMDSLWNADDGAKSAKGNISR